MKNQDIFFLFLASIKDGYAVISDDKGGLRKVIGASNAGNEPEKLILQPGECVRINTGAPVPAGADAVVQVEDTELTKTSEDGKEEVEIKILSEPKPGQDIRPLGSDIQAGMINFIKCQRIHIRGHSRFFDSAGHQTNQSTKHK